MRRASTLRRARAALPRWPSSCTIGRLNERVELTLPVGDAGHKERIKDILDLQLRDNQKAHIMRSDGVYRKSDKRSKAVNSQKVLMDLAISTAKVEELSIEQRLRPRSKLE